MKTIFKDFMPLLIALVLVYGTYISAALAWPALPRAMFDMWVLVFETKRGALLAMTMTNLIVCSLLMAAFMLLFGARIRRITDKLFK